MRTSLQAIANKASKDKGHRFTNLSVMLHEANLAETWRVMNRKSAPGVDGVNVMEYERDFKTNVHDLTERLKGGNYRAKLVRRVHIPKENGKMRPLGLPATEDKLVQATVTRILSAIYEADFLACSFGYRPGGGARRAADDVNGNLMTGKYHYVVEADIKGFFDNIDHDWLERMLELRVADRGLIRLIKKWLKAGVLETDGKVIHPLTGTPQGGIVSPILANIYLHYALDLWFERTVRRHCRGAIYMCRYADDFVCAFERKEDAERFYKALPKRLGKVNLSLATEKTRILKFSRNQRDSGNFDFLGFEFRWGKSRKGFGIVRRRTSRKRFRKSLKTFASWCRENRHWRMNDLFRMINAKLRGYYLYYGVTGNIDSLQEFHWHAMRAVFKWLNQRSQRTSYTWVTFMELQKQFLTVKPVIPRVEQQHILGWQS